MEEIPSRNSKRRIRIFPKFNKTTEIPSDKIPFEMRYEINTPLKTINPTANTIKIVKIRSSSNDVNRCLIKLIFLLLW